MRPADELELLPMSDGGDGFGEVMGRLFQARLRSVKTINAAHQPVRANWWWEPRQKLAIIEAARVIGLAMLPPGKFHPFQLDTFGLGCVLDEAARAGARHCLIGIGGSATNDAGFGLARALGWKFLDGQGMELEQWWQLTTLARVMAPRKILKLPITVAVDVANPLLGPRGCTRVYGPQKGITPEDVPLAEQCLQRLKTVLARQLGLAHARTPGAGAAGGLGFGLLTFAGARARSGFEIFAEAADLEERIRRSTLVITGEGAVDRQTRMGKGVGQVIRLCRELNVPCVTLAGTVAAETKAADAEASVFALTDLTSLKLARSRPQYYLERLAAKVAGLDRAWAVIGLPQADEVSAKVNPQRNGN